MKNFSAALAMPIIIFANSAFAEENGPKLNWQSSYSRIGGRFYHDLRAAEGSTAYRKSHSNSI